MFFLQIFWLWQFGFAAATNKSSDAITYARGPHAEKRLRWRWLRICRHASIRTDTLLSNAISSFGQIAAPTAAYTAAETFVAITFIITNCCRMITIIVLHHQHDVVVFVVSRRFSAVAAATAAVSRAHRYIQAVCTIPGDR